MGGPRLLAKDGVLPDAAGVGGGEGVAGVPPLRMVPKEMGGRGMLLFNCEEEGC